MYYPYAKMIDNNVLFHKYAITERNEFIDVICLSVSYSCMPSKPKYIIMTTILSISIWKESVVRVPHCGWIQHPRTICRWVAYILIFPFFNTNLVLMQYGFMSWNYFCRNDYIWMTQVDQNGTGKRSDPIFWHKPRHEQSIELPKLPKLNLIQTLLYYNILIHDNCG